MRTNRWLMVVLLALFAVSWLTPGKGLAAGPVSDVRVDLRAGYNAVAFQAPRITQLSANPAIPGLFSWSSSGYAPASFSAGSLNGRQAYWVFATTATSFTYSGENDGAGDFVDLPAAGYQLVSFACPAEVPGSSLQATRAGQPVALASVVLPTFHEIQPDGSYQTVDVTAGGVLKPGRAYWVFATQAARLSWGGVTTSSLTLVPTSVEIPIFNTREFRLTDDAGRDVTLQAEWRSRDGWVTAFVSPGVAKGLNPGETLLTATYGGREVAASVRVTDLASPPGTQPTPTPTPPAAPTIYASATDNTVWRRLPGQAAASFAPSTAGRGLAFGPDSNLYTVTPTVGIVNRNNGITGNYMNVFFEDVNFVGDSNEPLGLVLRNGDFYLASSASDRVIRFNGTTGAYVGDFVSPGLGGLTTPVGLAFSPLDGSLWVMADNGALRRYNSDGTFDRLVTTVPAPGRNLAFTPSGNAVYVTYGASPGGLLRFNGVTGAVEAGIADSANYWGVAIDAQGNIYGSTGSQVRHYSPAHVLVETIPFGATLRELIVR